MEGRLGFRELALQTAPSGAGKERLGMEEIAAEPHAHRPALSALSMGVRRTKGDAHPESPTTFPGSLLTFTSTAPRGWSVGSRRPRSCSDACAVLCGARCLCVPVRGCETPLSSRRGTGSGSKNVAGWALTWVRGRGEGRLCIRRGRHGATSPRPLDPQARLPQPGLGHLSLRLGAPG